MEPVILIAGVAILICAVLLSSGVERIIRRINAHPAEPDERSRGIREVFSRLERWRNSRNSR